MTIFETALLVAAIVAGIGSMTTIRRWIEYPLIFVACACSLLLALSVWGLVALGPQ